MGNAHRRENTLEWRNRVRERLRDLKRKPAWLARRADIPDATVSRILNGGSGTSKHIDAISRALGLPEPHRVAEVAREYPYAGTGKPESCERLALAHGVLALRKTVGDLAKALDEYGACVSEGDWKRAEEESVWPVRDLVEKVTKGMRVLDVHHTNWAFR